MLNRGIEDELLNYCQAHNIGVIVYSPMECGLLTGKYTKESIQNLPEDDWRRTKNPHFQEPELFANLKLVEGLRPIAEENNRTVAQLAVAWVLRKSEVTAAIVGARHPSQIEETALAGEWALSKKDIAAIERLLKERGKAR
ncbi:aldo/keto reductase, partial [bacterium]|nr:aldo/keto reductase [bacterium]